MPDNPGGMAASDRWRIWFAVLSIAAGWLALIVFVLVPLVKELL